MRDALANELTLLGGGHNPIVLPPPPCPSLVGCEGKRERDKGGQLNGGNDPSVRDPHLNSKRVSSSLPVSAKYVSSPSTVSLGAGARLIA